MFRSAFQEYIFIFEVQWHLHIADHAYDGTMLVGESGRGRRGKVYYYYKCGKKKRGGSCELKPIPKDDLEEVVIRATMEDMLTDETISDLTDEILRIQAEETDDPAEIFRKQLADNKRKQKNLLAALEEGSAAGVVRRLSELEDEAADLEARIMREELKRPPLKRETVEGWLRSFRGGDVNDEDFVARLLETFVAKVEVQNDFAVIYYNITDKKRSPSGVRIRTVWWTRRGSNPRTSRMRTVRSPIRDSYNGQKAGKYMSEIERIKKERIETRRMTFSPPRRSERGASFLYAGAGE